MLVYALTGRAIPTGKRPADIGCLVFNAETCAVVFRAFAYGMPLTEKAITVDGDCIKEPKNLLVTVGTSYREVIDYCGGLIAPPYKVISGGPMMGAAQWDMDAPVVKGTSGLLVFSEKLERMYTTPQTCIRCGRCVEGCPMRLMPLYLASFAKAGNIDMCEKFDLMSCMECGSCVYNCPGNVPIVQHIRVAKAAVKDAQKAHSATAAKTPAATADNFSAEAKEEHTDNAKNK